PSKEDNTLWKLMLSSYQVLNATNPDLTEHCWLYYGMKPPFYEAVGVTEEFKWVINTNPKQCTWEKETQRITLTQITGKGRCIG
ncbi:ENV1 protein, partial [Dryoscopus gambensis]|nr:ENV1 protein [Dryoscopus gambensis]